MRPAKRVGWMLLASAFAIGLAYSLSPSRGWTTSIDIVSILLIGLLVYVWYREDARERTFRRGRWQNIGVAGVGFVGLPVYLFRTRGASRGMLALVLGVLFYFLMLVVVLLGSVAGMLVRAVVGMPIPGVS